MVVRVVRRSGRHRTRTYAPDVVETAYHCVQLHTVPGDLRKKELLFCVFFFSSRRRHTRFDCDWSSDVCSSDLEVLPFWQDCTTLLWLCQRYEVCWRGSAGWIMSGRPSPSPACCTRFTPNQFASQIGRASCRERV